MKFKSTIRNTENSKIERQREAIEKWQQSKGIGTFLHCPRFGKLYEGVEVISRVVQKHPSAKILVLVPSDIILQQWKELVYKKIGTTYAISLVTLHRLNNIITTILDVEHYLIVIDEFHKAVSGEQSYNNILALKTKFKLGLLGIKPDETLMQRIESFAPVIDVITESEAIQEGWISNYTEYNLPLELSEDDKIAYAKFSIPMRELLSQFKDLHKSFKVNGTPVFDSELDLIISCYTGKKMLGEYVPSERIRAVLADLNGWSKEIDTNDSIGAKIDNMWNPVNLYDKCKVFKNLMDKRNEILIDNEVKLNMIVEIMQAHPVPTIIFNESIDFVEKVVSTLNNAGIKSVAYHSKIESRPLIDPKTGDYFKVKSTGKVKMFGKKLIKDYAVEGLNHGYFTCLVTVKALDEGFTCHSIEQVITTAGSTNPVNYGQRIARGNTINPYKPDKVSKVINLYFDDFILPDGSKVNSRDKAKLRQRQVHSSDIKNVMFLDEIFGI